MDTFKDVVREISILLSWAGYIVVSIVMFWRYASCNDDDFNQKEICRKLRMVGFLAFF